MAVLLSLKKIDNVEADSNNEDNIDSEKYSLGNVKSYFKNLMKTNSYSLEKPAKKKSPLPEIVKEFFTIKNADEAEVKENETSLSESVEEQEILLDDRDSNSSIVVNSFTNLQLRLLNDSLDEAEASFEKLVKDKNDEQIEDHDSLTFSFDDESLKDGCFGQLQIHQIDLCEFEHEIDLSEDEDDDDSTDSDSDIVKNHLEDEETTCVENSV